MIIVNFKNYKTGKEALNLAKKIQKNLPNAIICPSNLDLQAIKKETKLEIFSQHSSGNEGNKTTGFVTPETLKKAGIKGTLLNHSEHKLSEKELRKTVKKCKENGIKTVVCVSSITEASKIKNLSPYAIAYEEPRLISTGKSITHKSQKVKTFVSMFKKSKILPICGAGISKKTDVEEAYKLGCKGVIIASAIAKSKNPEKLLKQIKEVENKKDRLWN